MTSTENSVGIGAADAPNTPQDAAVVGLLERLESQRVINAWNRPLGPVDKEHVNPDGPEAASVIRSLTAERDAFRSACATTAGKLMVAVQRAERAEAERDALREALERAGDRLTQLSDDCFSTGRDGAGEDAERYAEEARAALSSLKGEPS